MPAALLSRSVKKAAGAYPSSASSYCFCSPDDSRPFGLSLSKFGRADLRGMLGSRAEAGVCARRRSGFLLLRQKKVTKEKATLHAASLRFAAGNLRCSRPAGSRSNSLHCVALRQSRALIRWPLRSSAHPEGNPGSGHPFGPLLRSAPVRGRRRLALGVADAGSSAATTRVAVGMFGCLAVHPLWLRLRRGGCGVAWAQVRPCFVI